MFEAFEGDIHVNIANDYVQAKEQQTIMNSLAERQPN